MHKSIKLEQRLRLSILLVLLVILSLVWVILLFQENALKRQASQASFTAIENQILTEIDSMSVPAEIQLSQLRDWGEAGMFSGHTLKDLTSFFVPVLRSISDAKAFRVIQNNGTSLQLTKVDDTTIVSSQPSNSSHISMATFPGYPATDTCSNDTVIWVAPSISPETHQPIVTAATAWTDPKGAKMAIAFDFHLAKLRAFVQTLTVGDGGKVFLINSSDHASHSKKSSNMLFAEQSSIEDEVIANITNRDFSNLKPIEKGLYRVSTDRGKYWVKFVSIRHMIPQCSIMIVAPEKGINEKLERKAMVLNIISGTFLIAGVLLLLVLLYQSLFTYRLIQNVGELNTIFANSRDLDSFLDNTVSIIAGFIRVPVCSIYLYDEHQNTLTLKATHGLNKKLINHTSLAYGEGLVGLTLKEVRPIRVTGASSQNNFRKIEGLNEEQFDSFLAVPIIKGIRKIGVLVIQKRQIANFTQHTVETLEILAAQLTGVLETTGVLLAATSQEIPEFSLREPLQTLTEIKGKTASPGYALGSCSIDHKRDIFTILKRMEWDTRFTLKDFENAVQSTEQELERLQRLVEERLEDSAAMIFVAHLLMLKDNSFAGAIRSHIENGISVPESVLKVSEHLIRSFASSPARMIQEKAEDVKDLAVRLLSYFSSDLNNRQNHRDRIVIARELLPSDILVMASEGVKGVVLVSGGVTSHLAILCRSLQIPLMLTTDTAILSISADSELLLDANNGMLYINPDKELRRKYRPLLAGNIAGVRSSQKSVVTRDGTPISVHANINLITDISQAMNLNIEGIGLYRSEFPFMIRESFPTEPEQYAIYKKVAEFVPNREMTFRTLDIGGDKTLPYLEGIEEENPFLGLRAIRFSLQNEPLFVNQLKAILRAAVSTDLRIMFPMIQSIDEFNAARSIVLRTIEELQSNGIICHPSPKIGMMVELPAAVTLIEQFAKVSDFFSIGTNDLIQYLLAVDRTNSEVASLYKPHHPAVLASIAKVAEAARAHGRDLSVCGDMAGNERYIPFLIGCGISKLSVDPVYIPRVQECIARIDTNEAVALTESLLACSTVAETETILRQGI